MNRREFVKSGACAVAAAGFPELFARAHGETGLSETEQTLFDEMLAKYEEVNPVDPATGIRKFIAFGALSDLHACKRTVGDDDQASPKKDFWYYWGAVLTDSAPSIWLLGALAQKVGLDAIIHAGDFSTANTLKPFAPGDYRDVIRGVKAAISHAAPGVPFFTVDGNHDRDYWSAKTKSGNRMDNAEWAEVLKEVNTDVSGSDDIVLTRHRDLANPSLGEGEDGPYTGNSYTLDFRRLVKTGGANVRLVVVSQYDKGPGCGVVQRAADGFRFDGAKGGLGPSNTVIGFLSHDMMKSIAPRIRAYLDANAGSRVFGAIAGHLHYSYMVPFGTKDAPLNSKIHGVTNCFCEHGTTSREACRLSLFVFDTERGRLHEIRLSGGDKPNPKHPARTLRPNRPTVSVSDFDCAST